MTKVLLDTHALVWAVSAPSRLGAEARALIEEPSTDIWVSAATAWELAIKTRLGKFPEAEPIVAQYRAAVETLGAVNLSVAPEHALRAGGLRWDHRDPFDRMLATQAMLEHAILLSRDSTFVALVGLDVRW